jgi:hypothetical protein
MEVTATPGIAAMRATIVIIWLPPLAAVSGFLLAGFVRPENSAAGLSRQRDWRCDRELWR